MIVPERIHITWNGADVGERFAESGAVLCPGDQIDVRQITEVLARQAGQLFVLVGHTARTLTEVCVRVNGRNASGLSLSNRTEPQFTGNFVVADEPPAYFNGHLDCVFDLVRAE